MSEGHTLPAPVQLAMWTRYELTGTYGPPRTKRTKIRPSPGRQTSGSRENCRELPRCIYAAQMCFLGYRTRPARGGRTSRRVSRILFPGALRRPDRRPSI